jgi:hypothetical protein
VDAVAELPRELLITRLWRAQGGGRVTPPDAPPWGDQVENDLRLLLDTLERKLAGPWQK